MAPLAERGGAPPNLCMDLSTELTRMQASRAVRFFTFLSWVFAAGVASAATPALVIDVESGKVLYAERATDPWFPASITKLMTAYVALSAVREGRLSLNTPLTISDLAHSMPPSKMGFPPGIEITLDNALKIIMVKSANDISVSIAEGVGGSVEGFAGMMNAAAQRLGMRESHFVNPHGLPDERQQTSARDMAILGRALLREFPEHAGYFQIGAIKFGRRVMNNHNGLMGRYAGADGMKTGFICASGFNVVASATRNGRRLITVVMGSTSAAERTVKAAALFDHGFNSWGLGAQTIEQLPASNVINAPNMRPVICERRGPLPAEEDAAPAASAQTDDSRPQTPTALAFSAGGSTPGGRPQLGPRARFEPILVWTGRTPPTALAAQEEPAPAKPTKLKQKSMARAGKAGRLPASAQAFAATEPKSIIDDGKRPGNKGAIRPNAALDQKPAAASAPKPKLGALGGGSPRPKPGAITAKPKPTQSAAVSSPPATAKPLALTKPPAVKPVAATKPGPSGKPDTKQSAKSAEPKKQAIAVQAKPKTAAKAKPQAE
jgi:D-alanyl-D-alanine carboxypeptidase